LRLRRSGSAASSRGARRSRSLASSRRGRTRSVSTHRSVGRESD
jgi:hypothetical protein